MATKTMPTLSSLSPPSLRMRLPTILKSELTRMEPPRRLSPSNHARASIASKMSHLLKTKRRRNHARARSAKMMS